MVFKGLAQEHYIEGDLSPSLQGLTTHSKDIIDVYDEMLHPLTWSIIEPKDFQYLYNATLYSKKKFLSMNKGYIDYGLWLLYLSVRSESILEFLINMEDYIISDNTITNKRKVLQNFNKTFTTFGDRYVEEHVGSFPIIKRSSDSTRKKYSIYDILSTQYEFKSKVHRLYGENLIVWRRFPKLNSIGERKMNLLMNVHNNHKDKLDKVFKYTLNNYGDFKSVHHSKVNGMLTKYAKSFFKDGGSEMQLKAINIIRDEQSLVDFLYDYEKLMVNYLASTMLELFHKGYYDTCEVSFDIESYINGVEEIEGSLFYKAQEVKFIKRIQKEYKEETMLFKEVLVIREYMIHTRNSKNQQTPKELGKMNHYYKNYDDEDYKELTKYFNILKEKALKFTGLGKYVPKDN